LSKIHPENKLIEENLNEIKSNELRNLQYPKKDFHVTSLFIGKDRSKTKTLNYTTFQEGIQVDVSLVAIAYVPNFIMTGICFVDQSKIKVENEFPHVTLMTGKWQAKESNSLLTALCGKEGPLHTEYTKHQFEKIPEFCGIYKVKVGNQDVQAYVFKCMPNLTLTGTTHIWF